MLFRDQKLTPEQHIAFSARLGELLIHVLDQWRRQGPPELNEGHTIEIQGLPEDEARLLRDSLCAHCTQPEFSCRHNWREGDLLMWDNIPTQHLAIFDDELPQRRYMLRTTLHGAEFH